MSNSDSFESNSSRQGFQEQYKFIQSALNRLKQQNDALQSYCDMEMDNELIQLIQQQRKQIKDLIDTTRKSLEDLEKGAQGFDKKKQAKQIKQFFVKEVERNRQIMRQMVAKSFGSFSKDQEEENSDVTEKQVQEVFSGDYRKFKDPSFDMSLQAYPNMKPHQVFDQDALEFEQKIDFRQVDFEKQILQQNQHDIDLLEQDSEELRRCMKELNIKVEEQGKTILKLFATLDSQLDIIGDTMITTKENLIESNKELQQANTISQQSRKKYVIMALIVFLVASGLISWLVYYFYFQ